MRFILCARERVSGAVTLLSAEALPTRKEAVDAGARNVTSQVLAECELFLVDLDAATPVMVVNGERAERPVAAATAPPLFPNPFLTATPVDPSSAWTQVEPAPMPEPRTAQPEPVDREVVIEEWPFVPGDEVGGVGPSTLRSDRCDDDNDLSGVWWLETGAEQELAALQMPMSDQTRTEETPMAAEAPVTEETRAEAPASEEQPADDTFVAFAYRSGRVDLTAWVCTDCVYSATCPRSETDTPASCGSFQWKPV